MLGKIVKVQHAQSINKSGIATLRPTKPVYEPITTVYVGGQVRVANTLDVWDIVPSKDSKAAYETALPEALQT